MRLKTIYLCLCVLGVVLPYAQLIPWLLANGLNASLFFHQALASPISSFFVMDVLVSAVAIVTFARREGRRLQMKRLWIPILAVFLVGVSLGLPLFLYMRERQLETA